MNRKYQLDKILIDAYNFHRSNMFHEALECYMAAAEEDQENEEIWFEMSSCLYSLGNYQKFLECGIKSIKINDNNKKVWFNCGLALSMMNEDNRAIAFYTEAIKLDPSYFMAHFARANAYYFEEEWSLAIKDYTIALTLVDNFSSEEEECHYYRGLSYEKLESFDFARIDYNWVLRKNPHRYDAIRKRALLSLKENKCQTALEDIKRARKLYPESKSLFEIQKKIELCLEEDVDKLATVQ